MDNGFRLLWFNLATDADDPVLGFTTAWIRELARHAAVVNVVTMRAGRIAVPANVRVYSVGKEKGYSEPRRVVEFYRHLADILRGGPVDACFSHMAPIFSVLAAPILRARSVPLVTWYAHPSLTWTLRAAHHLSDRMVASLATAYPYRRDKLVVIGQGIDTEVFAPDGGVPPHVPATVLCAGRLSPVKDHATLIRAARALRDRGTEAFQVVFVGAPTGPDDESYAARLREKVRALGLEGHVLFEGPATVPELVSWYRRCTVHVNLTPTGSGDKVAWEAMSCGRPCLIANQGFRETLGRWADDLLFRFGDAGHLADRLAWVLSRAPVEREAMGNYLRQQVVEHHSLERLGRRIREVFRDCVK